MRAPAASAIAVACGTPMPSTPRLVHAWPGPDADEHADRAGAHEVQRGGVRRATADDHGQVELADELLQVERLALGVVRHVLGRDHRALDDEHVELGVEHVLGVLLDPLRRERRARDDAAGLDLADALRDQLFLDRLVVELLHPARRLLGRQRRDLLEDRARGPRSASRALRGSGTRARRAGRSRSRSPATRRRPSRRPSSAARTCTRRPPT